MTAIEIPGDPGDPLLNALRDRAIIRPRHKSGTQEIQGLGRSVDRAIGTINLQAWTLVLIRFSLTLLLSGVFVIALVRLAPGYGVDERELDPRFGNSGIASMRQQAPSILALAKDLSARAFAGDWGNSEIFGTPVAQLLSERWRTTLESVFVGLMLAWVSAILWAGLGTLFRPLDWSGSVASLGLLSLPSGLVAIALFLAGAPVSAGIGIAVFPQIHRYVRQLAAQAMLHPAVFAAAARGVGRWILLCRHVRALIAPQLLALFGTSAAIAVGAAIPMEAICGSPGLGQLAWRAALGRDLALLLPLVLLTTATIQLAGLASELLRPGESAAAI